MGLVEVVTRPGFEQYKEELAPYFDDRDMICKVKQDVWMRYQQPQLAHHEATHPDDYAARGRNLRVLRHDSWRDGKRPLTPCRRRALHPW